MKLTKFLMFFRKETHPSYLQDKKIISYANQLLKKDKFTPLYEMIENGYQLTPKQSDILSSTLSRAMFQTKMSLFNKFSSDNLNSLLLIYKKESYPHSFYHGFAPYNSHDNLFLYIRFDTKFFYRYGKDSLQFKSESNMSENSINYCISDDSHIIKNGIDVIASVISFFLDNKNKKNNDKIKTIMSLIPIEFHPFLIEKESRLKNFIDEKFNLSNYQTLKDLTSNSAFSLINNTALQKEFKEKESFYLSAKKFLPTISTIVQEGHDLHQEMLKSLNIQNKKNINELNFITSDITKSYELSEDNQKKISLIQAIYGKLIIEKNLSTENQHFVTNIPKNTLDILNKYESSKEILGNDALQFLDSLDVLMANLLNINLQSEQEKIQRLSTANTAHKGMSK